jgi:hypothetical protein
MSSHNGRSCSEYNDGWQCYLLLQLVRCLLPVMEH